MALSLSASRIRGLYILMAVLSGACGTGYEVLYNRALTSVLGHTFAVNASILVTFLLGIAIGGVLAHKLLRFLWAVEAWLGLYTLVFFRLLSSSGSYGGAKFLYFFSISHASTLVGAGLLTFIPATLVGMSVPIFSRYIKEYFRDHPFRIIYILYNLGAMGGVLTVEFILLRIMPISRTAYLLGALNLLIGLLLFFMPESSRPLETARSRGNAFPASMLLSLFILSVASAIFQLFFLKTVYYTTGRFNANFALALGTVFFYLAAGTLLVQKKPSFTRWIFPAAALSSAFWFAAQPAMLFFVALLNSVETKLHLPFGTAWVLSAVWLGFPLIFFGASVPACLHSRKIVTRNSGILLLVSGLGNVAGYLLFVLALHPHLKIQYVLLAGCLIALLSLPSLSRVSRALRIRACLVSLVCLFVGLFTWNEAIYFVSLEGYRSLSVLKKDQRLTFQVEEFPSHEQTFALRHYYSPVDEQERLKYFMDGYVSLDLPSEEAIAGSYAAMYPKKRDKLLVLGFGTGMSAGAAAVFFKKVDLVELNPEVIRLQDRFADINFNVHRLSKTRIFQGDGFQYLVTTGKKYDLIINSVTAPFFPASSKMYTDEFYRLVVQHLRPGGVFSAWFDVRLHPDAIPIFFKTLRQHFKFCAMNYVYDAYYVLACSNRPLRPDTGFLTQGDVPLDEYEEVVDENIRETLKDRALIGNVLEPKYLDALGVRGNTPVNTLDWPRLEHYHPEEAIRSHLAFMERLLPFIDFGYSLVDGRPLTQEEFTRRCDSLGDWFEDAQPECRRQLGTKVW